MKPLFKVQDYNLAEWIPFLRLVSVPFVLVLIGLEIRLLVAFIYFVSFCTDALDGFVARTFRMETDRRGRLDSIADEFLLAAGVIGLYIFEPVFFAENSSWIFTVIGLYIFQLLFALIRYGTYSSFHTISARAATVVQAVFFMSMFFFGPQPWLFTAMIGLSLLDSLEEVALIARLPQWQAHVNGIFWLRKAQRAGNQEEIHH
ncbi:CDP-alcohol phosphatidyltransferase family protein [Tunicatimonas pelagia]|uniref:CDP-alcohol phosphatidyltransferase family protein n=1 Tax=Tunicatimonas pelagia TaxID=931531 RepID=UPI00266674D1|nr:CDP-alcohol phosphatidyltransferase family protein [Tunicatimonas pelagia]WKN44676.1 CDP-alcohol phosphatidyltransferase family protein [Tunicatimonas pelagia]